MTRVFHLHLYFYPKQKNSSNSEGCLRKNFMYCHFSFIKMAWCALFAESTKEHSRVAATKYSQMAILLSVNIIAITELISAGLTVFFLIKNKISILNYTLSQPSKNFINFENSQLTVSFHMECLLRVYLFMSLPKEYHYLNSHWNQNRHVAYR